MGTGTNNASRSRRARLQHGISPSVDSEDGRHEGGRNVKKRGKDGEKQCVARCLARTSFGASKVATRKRSSFPCEALPGTGGSSRAIERTSARRPMGAIAALHLANQRQRHRHRPHTPGPKRRNQNLSVTLLLLRVYTLIPKLFFFPH